MPKKFILIFLLLPLKLLAQNITGVWTGTIYNDTTKKYIPYELAISEDRGKLSGFSHTTFIEEDGKKVAVKSIKLKRKDDQYFVEDDEWIYKSYPEPAPKGVKQHSILNLISGDSEMILTGTFNTNRTKEYLPITGTIRLKKKIKVHQTNIIPQLDELKLSNTLSFLQPKKENDDVVLSVTQSSLQTNKKEIISVPVSLVTKNITPDLKPPVLPEAAVYLVKIKPSIISQNAKEINIAYTKKITRTPSLVAPIQKPVAITETPKQIKPIAISAQKIKEKDVVISSSSARSTPVIQTKEKQTVVVQTPQKTNNIPLAKPEVKQKVSLPIASNPLVAQVSEADISKRKIETIKSVYFKSDSLTLTLYDNGEVDGDTVSVIVNGKTIMPRVGLSTNAVKKTIYTSDFGDSLQIIMYAENLGSIPPNTGLLIVQDGDDRYEIRFAGDLQKNSAIILRRKSLSQ